MKHQPTVLIVDDEAGLRRVLGRAFALRGFESVMASCGEEAAEVLKGRDVDAILMDLRMPGMSGRTLYHLVVSNWPHLADRIIAMSGDTHGDDSQAWLDANDVPVLSKPFELHDAVRVVERLLVRRREANGT